MIKKKKIESKTKMYYFFENIIDSQFYCFFFPQTFIFFPVFRHRFIALDIASLAQTCKSVSTECRIIHCKHFGKIFKLHELHANYNKRVAHVETCKVG
jgi:hypothetical protein